MIWNNCWTEGVCVEHYQIPIWWYQQLATNEALRLIYLNIENQISEKIFEDIYIPIYTDSVYTNYASISEKKAETQFRLEICSKKETDKTYLENKYKS